MPAVSTGHIKHSGHCRPLAIFRILLLLLLPLLAVARALAVTAIPAPTPVLQLGGTGPGYFGEASSVALDSSGNIYVGDLENQRIQEFDSGGSYLGQFAVGMDPVAITIANGIVYIAGNNSSTGHNLREYNLSTAQLSTGFGSGSFQSVAVDPAGNVYVVESSHGDIQQYSPTGTLLNSSFGGSTGVAIATDANNLYLTTCGQAGPNVGRVQKFNFSGTPVSQWTTSDFTCGVGVAVDSAGDIRIADYDSHQVSNFTNSGTLIFQTGSIGQGQFYHPTGVAVNSQGQTIVADEGNSRVQILDGSGNFVSAFGHPTLYSYEDETAVTSTPDGHIYVTDTLPDFSAERLSVFDSEGNLTFLRYFADVIQGKYQNLDFPSAVSVAADGSIYVNFSGSLCTYGFSNLIIKFDSNLNPLTAADSPHCPGGMTVDALGLVYGGGYDTDYVYDANLNRTGSFQFIGTNGDIIGTTGSIAVDSQGVIYVATGTDLGIYTGPSASEQIGFFPLIGQSLAVAPDRTLFVTDFNFNTLSVYPPESTNAQVIWNLPYEPTNVSADQSRVYVVSGTSGGAPASINVNVYTTPIFISSVTPPTGGNTGTVTVTIGGRGFQQGAMAVLLRTGQPDLTATNATIAANGTSITAQLNLTGASPGTWDVLVSNPDGTSATLPAAFTIASGNGPLVWVEILGSSVMQPGVPQTFIFLVGNAGGSDAQGDLLVAAPPDATCSLPSFESSGSIPPTVCGDISLERDDLNYIPITGTIQVTPGQIVSTQLQLTLSANAASGQIITLSSKWVSY
jgi:sugar lactone lactonase YvrE